MHSQPARRLYVRFKTFLLCPDGVAAPRRPASGFHLCFGPWLAGGGMAQAQSYTIPVSGGGTLTYSYSQQSTCDGGFAEQWSGFSYTDPNNNTTYMVGSLTYLSDAGCGIIGGWDSNGSGSTNGNSNAIYFPDNVITQGQACSISFFADQFDSGGQADLSSCVNPSILYPQYKVTSILYDLPGNRSQENYTNSTTDGTRTSISSNFTQGTTTEFTEGFSIGIGGGFGVGSTLNITNSASATTGKTSEFTYTFTNASGLGNWTYSLNPNAVNHYDDLFVVWMNPSISILPINTSTVSYSIGTQDDPTGQPGPVDQIEVYAYEMATENSQGLSSVAYERLNHQYDAATGGYDLPGLAVLCKNLNVDEYNANQCTQADQCGCTPSDFTGILNMDPLLNYGTNDSPMNANGSSAQACGINPDGSLTTPSPNADCRYLPVPSSAGSTVQLAELLSGPPCTDCNSDPNTFLQSDSAMTTQTYSRTWSTSVSYLWKIQLPGINFGSGNFFQWSDSESSGEINGYANSQSLTLLSNTVGCYDSGIPIFYDTVFHTFVAYQVPGNTSCP